MVKKTVKEVWSSLAIPSPLVHMCLFVRSRSMLKMEHLTFLSSHFQHLRWVPNNVMMVRMFGAVVVVGVWLAASWDLAVQLDLLAVILTFRTWSNFMV